VCFGGSGKNGAIYKAIKRLEKHDMVKTKSTNKYTEFKVTNWWKYQGEGSVGKNEVKTKSKPSNTLIRIKNKELKNNTLESINLSEMQEKFPTKDVKTEFDKARDWIKSSGKRKKDYHAFFRNWLRNSKDARIPPREMWKPPADVIVNEEGLERIREIKKIIGNKIGGGSDQHVVDGK
jgi:hypothetical protein